MLTTNIYTTLMEEQKLRLDTGDLKGQNIKDAVAIHITKQNTGNVITDISSIRYKDYATQEEKIKLRPISDIFCDNLMVFTLVPEDALEKGTKVNLLSKTHTKNFNTIIREIFTENGLKPNMLSTKKPGAICNTQIYKAGFVKKEMLEKCSKILGTQYNTVITESNGYVVSFKVDLQDIQLKELLEKLPATLEQLKHRGIYLSDTDLTIDHSGTLDKQELITLLKEKYKYRLSKAKKDPDAEDFYTKTIINNDQYVGTNCLTYIYNPEQIEGIVIRVKLYNKFICQMETGGSKAFSNHIIDYIDCPVKRLKDTFNHPDAKDYGITRLEITMYMETPPSLEQATAALSESYDIMDDPVFYKVPLKEQYRAICDKVRENATTFCLIDDTHNKMFNVLWSNKITGKFVGSNKQWKEPATIKVKNMVESEREVFLKNNYEKAVSQFIESVSVKGVAIQVMRYKYENDAAVITDNRAYVKKEGNTYLQPGKLSKTGATDVPDTFKGQIEFAIGAKKTECASTLLEYNNLKTIALLTEKEIKKRMEDANEARACNAAKEALHRLHIERMDAARKLLMEFLEEEEQMRYHEEILRLQEQEHNEEELRVWNLMEPYMEQFSTTALSTSILPADKIQLLFIRSTQKEDCYIGLFRDTAGGRYLCFLDKYLTTAITRNNLLERLTQYNAANYKYCAPYKHTLLFTGNIDNIKSIISFTKTGNKKYGSREYSMYKDVYVLDNIIPLEIEETRNVLLNKRKAIKEATIENPCEPVLTRDTPPVKPVACKKLEDVAIGTVLDIRRLYRIEYRKKAKYIMETRDKECIISSFFLEQRLNGIQELEDITHMLVSCVVLKTTPANEKKMLIEIKTEQLKKE